MKETGRVALLALAALGAVAVLSPVVDAVSPLPFGKDAGNTLKYSFFALIFLVPPRSVASIRAEAALGSGPGRLRSLVRGLLAGWTSLLALHGLRLAVGGHAIQWASPPHPLGYVAAHFALAFLIGLTEELMFRGVIFSRIRNGGSAQAAILLSSVLFAASHSFHVPDGLQGLAGKGYVRGVIAASDMMRSWYTGILARPRELIGLFFVGAALAAVRERTGTIAASIGLHTGWVCIRFVSGAFIQSADRRLPAALFGSRLVYDGAIAWIALAATVFLVLRPAIRSAPPRPRKAAAGVSPCRTPTRKA